MDKFQYVYVVEPFKCDYIVEAEDEKSARKMLWEGFTDEEQNAVVSFELVDIYLIGQ